MSVPEPSHALVDLSQDTSGMWWWACSCEVTCDDATLSAMEAASGYLDHLAAWQATASEQGESRG